MDGVSPTPSSNNVPPSIKFDMEHERQITAVAQSRVPMTPKQPKDADHSFSLGKKKTELNHMMPWMQMPQGSKSMSGRQIQVF